MPSARAVLIWSLVLLVVPAWAHDGAPSNPAAAKTISAAATSSDAEETRARQYFSDLPLVDHDGRTVRFFTDVLRDRVVAVTFFYTECVGMCPIMNQKLSEVQDLLGERLGKDIYLVSISVDPETDTPVVLRQYRERFEAREGWRFLTGQKKVVEDISRRLGQVYDKEAHLPLILVGNVRTAHWAKLRPNASAEIIAERLRLLAQEDAGR